MDRETAVQPAAPAAALIAALLDLDANGVSSALELFEGDQVRLADAVVAPALSHLGDGWERGEVALSQVYMAGRLLERAMQGLPRATEAARTSPRIGIGVLGDRHSLGKRIVKTALKLAGFPVIDLGSGLRPEELAQRARAEDVELVMISVLMMHHALKVEDVVSALRAHDHPAPVVVGGAPFVHDPELWRRVGADAYGRSAADAIRIAAAYALEEAA